MLTVKNYFFDDEDDLWADIHCNGRRQWYTVVGCDKEHPLYKAVLNTPITREAGCYMIEEYCHEHGHEERMAGLPRIEDASAPMKMAWKTADEWDGPYTSLGYYLNEEQFQEDYMMPSAEFKKQLQADIDKYGISNEIIEERDGESLYSVTWWLCEYFTEAVNDG